MTRRVFIAAIVLVLAGLTAGCGNWMYNSPTPQLHVQVIDGKQGNNYNPELDDIEVYFNEKLIGVTEQGGYLKLLDARDEMGDDYMEVLAGDMIELKKGDYYAFKRITEQDIEKARKYRKIDFDNIEVFDNEDAANFIRIFIVENYTGITFFYPQP